MAISEKRYVNNSILYNVPIIHSEKKYTCEKSKKETYLLRICNLNSL